MNDETFRTFRCLRDHKTELGVTRDELEPTFETLGLAGPNKRHYAHTATHRPCTAAIQNDVSRILVAVNFLPSADSGKVYIMGGFLLFFAFYDFLNDKCP